MSKHDRLTIDKRGLDEVVWTGVGHLERMDKHAAFLCLSTPNGRDGFGVWLRADKGRLRISWEPRGPRAERLADLNPHQAGRI